MKDRCYCIFEGGGAKGIAHVGALSALEASDLHLSGFAGTSAGAVIAALAAVGYSAADLISESGTILDQIDLDRTNIWAGKPNKPAKRPSRLFGYFGWIGIKIARNGHPLLLLLLALLILFLLPSLMVLLFEMPTRWYPLLSFGCALLLVAIVRFAASGLASLDAFERGLNQLLRLRLAAHIDPATAHRARLAEKVTFADLHKAGCPPLRIVAADISHRTLKLFSYTSTPDMSVASAVAASVCLPVVFKPWKIADRLHLDGGLVSNLPAWAFDAERALDRDAWTAIVQVGTPDFGKRPPAYGFKILKDTIATGIFGSEMLNTRNVERLKSVRIPVPLGLLQFDPGLKKAMAVVDAARSRSEARLVYQLCKVPTLMKSVCSRVENKVLELLNATLQSQRKPAFTGKLRVSIFVHPEGDKTSLIAEYQKGFDDAPDERIRLPVAASIAGEALEKRRHIYETSASLSWCNYLSREMDRCTKKLIWPDIAWVLCIPHTIRHVNEPVSTDLVIAIDSDSAVDVPAQLAEVTMGLISEALAPMFSAFIPGEAFIDESASYG